MNITSNPNLSIFNFGANPIRVIADDPQQPYFVAKDVCEVLEINNPRQAVKNVESRLKEAGVDGVISNDTILKDRLGRKQTLITINEQGLYELIFASRKKQAVKFRAWVTGQILPQLRKTGSYSLPKPPTIRIINAQGRSKVRDIVRKLVDGYSNHYFDKNPRECSRDCIYQSRSAYFRTYAFIATYFNLDKGGYKNLTTDELNNLETILYDKQDEFLGDDVFVLTTQANTDTNINTVIEQQQQISELQSSLEASNEELDRALNFKLSGPGPLGFFNYFEQDKYINSSIYSINSLLSQAESIDFNDQQDFNTKLEMLECAYRVSKTLSIQIYDKSEQLKGLIKDITN